MQTYFQESEMKLLSFSLLRKKTSQYITQKYIVKLKMFVRKVS